MTTPDPACNGEGVRIGGYGNREVSCEVCEGTGEAVEARSTKLGYHNMGSGGRCDWTHLREAVAEAVSGSRSHSTGFDPSHYPGHQMVGSINYNSLDRIVTAFVDAALNPPMESVKAPSGTGEQPDTVEGVTQADRDTADSLDEALGFLMDAERDIVLEALVRHRLAATKSADPIPMILHCPTCHTQHIDEPDERTPEWDNPPHRSHLCHACGCIWRPADVPTEGVASIATVGKVDTWTPAGAAMPDDAVERAARAMCDSVNGVGDFDENIDQRRTGWERQARVAINAYGPITADDAVAKERMHHWLRSEAAIQEVGDVNDLHIDGDTWEHVFVPALFEPTIRSSKAATDAAKPEGGA